MLVNEGVPARIVLCGTSTIRLNDRFSRLPKRKTIAKGGRIGVRPRAFYNKNRDVVTYNGTNNRHYDNFAMGTVRYNPQQFRSLPRGRSRLANRVHVPIEQRISVAQKPKFVNRFPNRPGNVNRGGQRFNNNRNGYVSRGFHRENNRFNGGRFYKNNNNRLNDGNKNFNNRTDQKPSAEQLDRELDEYMRKQRHPRITA